jgi:SET domain
MHPARAAKLSILSILSWKTDAFQLRHHHANPPCPTTVQATTYPTSRRSFVTRLSVYFSVDESTPRTYNNFAGWASHYGLNIGSAFQLSESEGDWSVVAGTSANMGDELLHIPQMLILSSKRAQDEDFPEIGSIGQFFDKKGAKDLVAQFFLFLKVLKEYELGADSPYFAWLDAMPRKFSTAVCLDDFEMQCLPPFVGSLARLDRINFGTFKEALQLVEPEYISQNTKADATAIKWAFNIVFTRCWSSRPGEVQIVPYADMFNHASTANVQVQYDAEGNCKVLLTKDVQQGEPLTLSYGTATNPSRFLATFGFLDQSPPATFCKIMTARPTKELVNLGYDFSRMVFYVEDGAIAEEVWDVILYSLLESRPEERSKFYNAHMTQDRQTKVMMQSQYLYETISALLRHVERTLAELAELADKMQAEGPNGHDHLAMIWYHNEFVKETFVKVKTRLDRMLANETARRDAARTAVGQQQR